MKSHFWPSLTYCARFCRVLRGKMRATEHNTKDDAIPPCTSTRPSEQPGHDPKKSDRRFFTSAERYLILRVLVWTAIQRADQIIAARVVAQSRRRSEWPSRGRGARFRF